MTSRREFLEAAALSSLPVIAGTSLTFAATSAIAASPASNAAPGSPDFHLVLFDARYPQAGSGATRINRMGAAVHALADGDITQVWLDSIGPAWQRGPAVVAGLTARPALFCLEQLALSSGLRVVFHAEHIVHADGRTEHSLPRGAESVGLSSSDLTHAGNNWSARVADALATYRPSAVRPRFARSDAALEPTLPPQAQLLTSWIIAAA
ncbi:MAG: hypothetical protein WDO68_27360 [Gammaproteobacteria bacterium]